MLYQLQNGGMTVTADTAGAELHSLQRDGLEYLWQCGEAWQRYAPILFPFVCSPAGRAYKADGKPYRMRANHGFARDKEFTLLAQDAHSVSFVLTEDADTLAQYPYRFRLTVQYTLLPDGVEVGHTVTNTDTRPMYFYLGGHPAFNCPLMPDERFTDYEVVYEKPEQLTSGGKPLTLTGDGRVLPVTRALFDNDAIIRPQAASHEVTLRSRKSGHAVTVAYPALDCIAVWSPTGDDRAAFVCLEPWTSAPTSYDDAEEDIERKAHAIALAPGETYRCAYSIRVR